MTDTEQTKTSEPVEPCPVLSEEMVEQCWRGLLHRTPPDVSLDAALVTFDELRDIIASFVALARRATPSHTALEALRFIETWVSNPVGSYSTMALDGLFARSREVIRAALSQEPRQQEERT